MRPDQGGARIRETAAEGERNWLFAPADAPERCRKAAGSDADQVIWDLEDGVGPGAKAAARASIATLLGEVGAYRRPPWVRIEAPASAAGRADLALLRAHAALGRLVVPKADGESLRYLGTITDRGQWLVIIESAVGLWDLVQGRLRVPPGIEARLAFGALDYGLDVGIQPGAGEETLLHARSEIVWMSRVMHMPRPIDSVYPSFTDLAGLAEAARRAWRMGFGGKLAIHPAQLGPIAEGFSPPPETLAWARRVLAAAAADGRGALAVDGEMADRPVVERARAVLAAAGFDDSQGACARAADRGLDKGEEG